VPELAELLAISLTAISRHLKLVARASLVSNEQVGKRRRCRRSPQVLARAAERLDFARASGADTSVHAATERA
jgi:DNA-binding transcriptional ArsR family regulator